MVRDHQSERPLRFSATLTRNGPNWLFGQLHFQWDDRDPRPSDLLRPSTHLQIVRLVLHYIRGIARRAGTTPPTVISLGTNAELSSAPVISTSVSSTTERSTARGELGDPQDHNSK